MAVNREILDQYLGKYVEVILKDGSKRYSTLTKNGTRYLLGGEKILVSQIVALKELEEAE